LVAPTFAGVQRYAEGVDRAVEALLRGSSQIAGLQVEQ